MHLGRFHRTINILDVEFIDFKIVDRIGAVISSLSTVAANPGAQDAAIAYKTKLEELRQILQTSKFNRVRPIEQTILQSIDATEFVGDRLFERVKAAIADNHLMPALAAQDLTKLQTSVKAFCDNIALIDSAFTKLNVEYDELYDGEAEIGLLIPRLDGKSSLKEISKELNQWNHALSPIAELFDPTAPPLQIRTCSTTDWMIYLAATPPILIGISACLKGVNVILKDILEMRKLIEQLAGKKPPQNIIDDLEKNNENKLTTDIRALAERLVDEHFKSNEAARAAELKNAISQSLKTIAHKVTVGAKIELRVLPPAPPKETPGGPTEEELQQRQAYLSTENQDLVALSVILDNDIELITIDSDTQALVGLLEAPDINEERGA